MRIATKICIGFGVLLALVGVLASLVVVELHGMQTSLGRLSWKQVPSLRSGMDLGRNFSTFTTQAHLYLVSREDWRQAVALSAQVLLNADLRQQLAAETQSDSSELKEVATAIGEVEPQIQDAELLAQTGSPQMALAAWDSRVSPVVSSISSRLEHIQFTRQASLLNSAAQVMERADELGTIGKIVPPVAILAALIAVFVIARSVLVPVRRLERAVARFANGDLASRVDGLKADEMGVLATTFNQMADQVGSTIQQLHETRSALEESNEALRKTSARIQHELELASNIQQEILPADCQHFEIVAAAKMVAATDIGGDFYDLLPSRPTPDLMYVAIGDVSGKGIAAALLMVFVVSALRDIGRRERSPAEALTQLNRLMLTRFNPRQEMYTTLCLGTIDRNTLMFTFAKAGHEEPLWYHASTGSSEYLDASGLFVGMFNDGQYANRSVQLAPGDRLVLYTDGVVEARRPDGKPFGYERLRDIVEASCDAPAGELVAAIRDEVAAWSNSSIPRDDLTVVVLEIP